MNKSELFLAKVSSTDSSGAALILPGTSAATQKKYKSLSGVTLSANDRVLCARVSGVIVIIGKLT